MEMDSNDSDSEEERERVKDELYEVQKAMNEAGVLDEELICERSVRTQDIEGEDDAHGIVFSGGSPEGEVLLAAEKGNLDKLSRLLDLKPTLVTVQDRDGYTPLHRACYSNNVDVVKLLLQHNANVNARTTDGWTPLHSACKWNNHKCASLLLDFGADLNSVTNGGQTPLHLASSHPEAKETLLLLLLNPQIHINIRNNTGELASDIAHRHCKYYKLFTLHDECFNLI